MSMDRVRRIRVPNAEHVAIANVLRDGLRISIEGSEEQRVNVTLIEAAQGEIAGTDAAQRIEQRGLRTGRDAPAFG